jgi:CitMHS family citrate-Mg2+:H+ or citrate-Ca2+:H+ symporter
MLGTKERRRLGVIELQPVLAGYATSEMNVAGQQLAHARLSSSSEIHAAVGLRAATGGAEPTAKVSSPHHVQVDDTPFESRSAQFHDFAADDSAEAPVAATDPGIARPKLLWVNFLLTLALMAMLILGVLPLPVLFMIFFALAIMINYPKLQDQKERLTAHAANVLPVVSLIFAAGIFVGILQGTKMVDAIATSVIAAIPVWMGPYLAIVTGFLSIPFTFFISNDAFYYGIVPILAKAAAVYGISAAEIGRASVVGQPVHLLSPLVASTYLLVGIAKVEFGDHQRYTLLWSISASLVMLVAAVVFGVIPLVGSIP